ncbi:MAG: WYL domain-containing protein [Campylobacterota bacterium]
MSKLHDYDKILTRLTIILQRLYEGDRLSVSELAEEFNVSSKTIQRDFNERLYRFPIEKEGRKWKMQEGFHLTKERTPEESLVIEMLENIAEGIGAGFGSKAKMLFSKLQNQSENPILSKTIIEDLSDKLTLFNQLEEAITKHSVVVFNYNEKLRHVKPYKIVSFEGYWYLYGEEILENKLKTYYFKDIDHFKINHDSFTPNKEVYNILERAINAWFEPNKKPFEVIIHVSSAIAKYFHRRPLSSTQRIEKIYDDESMDIVLLATSDREILHEVKKWMPDLIIISPKPLAIQAKEVADKFLDRQITHLIH